MLTRRKFVAGGAALALRGGRLRGAAANGGEPDRKNFSGMALELAKKAGAAYADVRTNRYQEQGLFTRERQVRSIDSDASYGYGVRVLKKGSWGFAASDDFSERALAEVVRQAVDIAEADAAISSQPVRLAPEKPHQAKWKSAYTIDPFRVPVEKKIELLLKINETALKVKGARFVASEMRFVREDKFFA